MKEGKPRVKGETVQDGADRTVADGPLGSGTFAWMYMHLYMLIDTHMYSACNDI